MLVDFQNKIYLSHSVRDVYANVAFNFAKRVYMLGRSLYETFLWETMLRVIKSVTEHFNHILQFINQVGSVWKIPASLFVYTSLELFILYRFNFILDISLINEDNFKLL